MVRHVVLWTLKEELTSEEKAVIKKGIKESVENLKDVVPGIRELKVFIDGLETSNMDLLLDSTFDSAQVLAEYQVNPEHVAVAKAKVKPYIQSRSCFDYEI